ncbi:MAG TPA: amidohydrolase family protein [Pirellulales bacterium]|nr:amidohydrolase family protein [Pirellulales bacterium]
MTLPLAASLAAAPRTAPTAGLRENTPSTHAFVGGKLVIAPGKVIDDGTLLIRDGIIVAAGADLAVPSEARVWDCRGKTVYPGLIDAFGELSAEASKLGLSDKHGAGYWNSKVVPQVDADGRYGSDEELNKKLRSQGIASRLVAPSAGIIKGTSALVAAGDRPGAQSILKPRVAMHLMLTPSRGDDAYPKSPMGATALVRQALYDARWYGEAWRAYDKQPGLERPERNEALAALQNVVSGKTPVVVRTLDELYCLRAGRLAREFELDCILEGSGYEYRRVDAIRAAELPVILPLAFPKAPRVSTPEAAMSVSLEDLMHWDLAPENPGRLAKAGVKIAFTTHGLSDASGFLAAVRKAIERGLSAEAALQALTITPADLFDMGDRLGTLEAGKMANLVVASGDLFDRETKVLETWIDGERYEVETAPLADLRGSWEVQLSKPDGGTETLSIRLEGEPGKLAGKIKRGDQETTLNRASLDGAQFAASFAAKPLGWEGVLQISGTISGRPQESDDETGQPTWMGVLVWAGGDKSACSARRTAAFEQPAETDDGKKEAVGQADTSKDALYPVNFPLGAFGVAGMPEQPQAVLLQHATVWTCGPAGVLKDAAVLIREGKIVAVGADVDIPADAVLIDASGKHLTPGIIDCHTHIATDGGINEMSQTITAEVRIGDFLDSNDVHIYRQLAGGVTTANVLHGSANTIGGQNQVIKLRWGSLGEELKFAGAPGGIKFALGENVKQNHWGPGTRYPQTRMGVEQVVRDAFNAAIDYRRRWSEWREKPTGLPPRTDLELEALAEVLQGNRLVHCHCYRQDEILGFLRTCEEFGVRVRTLQHVLEGYKLADVIAKHGAGGSAFSDWWGYKFEVYDAIPYNGAMMHRAGVLTSFNSDDPELARRLNLEAAKAVKYGGVPPEEALKFVTYNPAKQLGIEAQVGSLEEGKDADLVVWSASPLSSYARCEQTWIDGRKYFDRQSDIERRRETAAMRAALIQRVLASGEPTEGLDDRKKETWPREDLFCHDHDDDYESAHGN